MLNSTAAPDASAQCSRELFARQLYRQYWAELCQYLRGRFGAGPPEPQDIAQQTFAHLATMKDPQRIANLRAFLYRTATNLAIDNLRSSSRQIRLLQTIGSAAECELACDIDPERILLGREKLRILQTTISSLSERDRSFLLSNRLEGASFAEIARQTGMSPAGVRLVVENSLRVCQSALQREEMRRRRARPIRVPRSITAARPPGIMTPDS